MNRTNKIYGFIIAVIILVSVFSANCFAMGDSKWEMAFGTNFQNAIAANNDVCISVGCNGVIFISEDGLNWTKEKINTDYNLNDIVWTGKEFIVIGDGGVIMSSVDGEMWKKLPSDTSADLKGILWSGEIFVAYGGHTVVTSKDGINWTANSLLINGIESMAVNNGIFIGLTPDGKGIISRNGEEWECFVVNSQANNDSYGEIVSFQGDFLITSSFGSGADEIYTSKDGISWTTIEVPKLSYMIPNEFISTDDYMLLSGRYSAVAYSKNVDDWSRTNLEELINGYSSGDEKLVLGLAFFKGQYIGVISDGSFMVSKDFNEWTRIEVQPTSIVLNSIATDGNSYLTVGLNGIAYSSSDGVNWAACSAPTKDNLLSIAWDGHQFVVLDEKGNIYSTETGLEWKYVNAVSALDTFQDNEIPGFSKLTYIQNQYFLLCKDPHKVIYSSQDLKVWNKISDIVTNISDIASNGTIMTAVSSDNSLYTAPEPENWTKFNSEIDIPLTKVIWGGNKFVAIGGSDNFAVSNDGSMWYLESTRNSDKLVDICWDGKGYLAVDDLGRTIYSKDLIYWNQLTDDNIISSSAIIWTGYRYISVGASAIKTFVPKDIIKVIVNEKPIKFDVAPVISNNRTLVPARYIFETIGAEVEWDEAAKKVIIKGKNKEVSLKINDTTAYVNNEAVQLDAAPVIVDGRTLIPLRFIAESFNAEVEWEQSAQLVIIKTKS